MDINKKITELNIILPKAPNPVGSYVAYKITNKMLFISGQISINGEGQITKGKAGKELSLEKSQQAAYLCGLNILAQANKACENDLNNIKSCIKITGFVNSTEDFVDQPKVINPVSELIANVFGENGAHTRAAVNVNSLPLGAAVEVDAIFEIK